VLYSVFKDTGKGKGLILCSKIKFSDGLGGTTQDIFSTLRTGVYDYIETLDNLQKYQKKIENLILWSWYLKKYEPGGKKQ